MHKLSIFSLLLLSCGGPTPPVTVGPVESPLEEVGSSQAVQKDEQPPEDPEAATTYIEEGRRAAYEGELSSAEALFQRALQAKANSAEAHYNLGVLAEWAGKLSQAKQHYQAALQAQPEFGLAVVALGSLQIRSGEPQAALSFAEEQLSRAPNSLSLQNAVNRLRLALPGQSARVIKDCKKVLRQDEKNIRGMIILASAFQQEKMYELAFAILENAKALSTTDPEIFARMAMAKQDLGEERLSRQILEEAVKLPAGGTSEIYNSLGLIYHKAGNFKEAETKFRQALSRWPTMLAAKVNLGNSLRGQQRYSDANLIFEEALRQSPGERTILYNLGILYLDGELPNISAIERLNKSLAFFQEYINTGNQSSENDPAKLYLEEARKRIKVEKQREEQARNQPKEAPDEEAEAPDEEAEAPDEEAKVPDEEAKVPDEEAKIPDEEAVASDKEENQLEKAESSEPEKPSSEDPEAREENGAPEENSREKNPEPIEGEKGEKPAEEVLDSSPPKLREKSDEGAQDPTGEKKPTEEILDSTPLPEPDELKEEPVERTPIPSEEAVEPLEERENAG